MTATPFDIQGFTPSPIQVIEASAGTGKTHALMCLYLRAILEWGHAVDRILVLTFTRAATAELRVRLTQALGRAAALLRAPSPAPDDLGPELTWLSPALLRDQRAILAARAEAALASVDEAAVHTIHGFCQRVLADYAFEAGLSLAPMRVDDLEPLYQRAVEYEWRSYALSADPPTWRAFEQAFKDPQRLRAALHDLQRVSSEHWLPRDPQRMCQELESRIARAHREISAWLAEPPVRRTLLSLLGPGNGLSRDREKGYSDARLQQLGRILDSFLRDPLDVASADLAWLADERIAMALMPSARKAGLAAPSHPVFTRLQEALPHVRQRETLQRGMLLRRFGERVARRVRQWAAERAHVEYDQLIRTLDRVLHEPARAPLRALLRTRYPLALLDEFQDTDTLQYRIFRALYAEGVGTQLVMVGDPKQSIYAFRGGDVFVWRQALKDASGKRYMLVHNWRSEQPLVHSLNHVFQAQPGVFGLDFVPFEPVQAAHPAPKGTLRDERAGHLVAWFVGDEAHAPAAQDAIGQQAVQACVDEVVRLLASSSAARAWVDRTGTLRALQATDIAVLVPRNVHVEWVRQALAAAGVAVAPGGVHLDGDPAVDEVLNWLQVLAQPREAAHRKRFTLYSLSGQVPDDPGRTGSWETWCAHWRLVYLQQGLLSALGGVLAYAAPYILAHPSGRQRVAGLRRLINHLHRRRGQDRDPQRTLDWLLAARADPGGAGDDEQESAGGGETGVQVMTIHKSKGLEFGIVFLPFAWQGREAADAEFARCHDADGQVLLDLGSEALSQHLEKMRQEALCEQVRLCYVALTRAIHRLYLVIAAHPSTRTAGLTQAVLGGARCSLPQAVTQGELLGAWRALAGLPDASIAVEACPTPVRRRLETPAQRVAGRAARLSRPVTAQWQITSYSALQHSLLSEHGPPGLDAAGPAPAEAGEEGMGGAAFGECFHGVMERLQDFGGRAALIDDQIRRLGLPVEAAESLERLVAAAWQAPIAAALRYGELPATRKVAEMGFYFTMRAGSHLRLARALRAHPRWSHLADGLAQQPLAWDGLMRGFIDLVYEDSGRFHLLDWKTNRLPSYDAQRLQQAMRQQGYDLQALIYAVALHRYLASRLRASYDAHRHLGDAVYVFVRGLLPAGGDQGIYRMLLEPDLVLELDQAFLERTA